MLSAHLPSHTRVLEGPPQHPAPGWWGSLHQTPIARQIAEASKSPKLGRCGDRHGRCPLRTGLRALGAVARKREPLEYKFLNATRCRRIDWLLLVAFDDWHGDLIEE
jgi:hypothetical protein